MAGWSVYGEQLLTADGTGIRVHQPVTFEKNLVLKAARCFIIIYNDPTFTSMSLKIYSDQSDSPRKLLHTSSTSPTKAEIITLENGIKEIPFEFTPSDADGITLRAGTKYHFVLGIAGYTGTASSLIAWKKAWPDPPYRKNIEPITFEQLHSGPYNITFVGSEL